MIGKFWSIIDSSLYRGTYICTYTHSSNTSKVRPVAIIYICDHTCIHTHIINVYLWVNILQCLGYCQCDSGVTGSTCLISNTDNPQTLSSDFNNLVNATSFPVIYGATMSTQCGVLSSGESLVFKYACT